MRFPLFADRQARMALMCTDWFLERKVRKDLREERNVEDAEGAKFDHIENIDEVSPVWNAKKCEAYAKNAKLRMLSLTT